MDTDERPNLSSSRESKLILKAETEKLIGFAFEVLNEIGHGLNEEIYENSLALSVLIRVHPWLKIYVRNPKSLRTPRRRGKMAMEYRLMKKII